MANKLQISEPPECLKNNPLFFELLRTYDGKQLKEIGKYLIEAGQHFGNYPLRKEEDPEKQKSLRAGTKVAFEDYTKSL